MALANNADVKLGSYSFKIDPKGDEPHVHDYESQYIQQEIVQGEDNARTASQNVLTWALDDFAGGAETKYFNRDVPDAYWYGNNNPRIRGSVTSPPDVSAGTFSLASSFTNNNDEIYVTPAGNKLWVGSRRDVFYSSDGTTYSQWNTAALFTANYHIRGMATDGFRPWTVATDGTTTKVRKVKSTTTETAAVTDRGTFGLYGFGMAHLAGYEFIWYGDKMNYYATTDTLPIAYSSTSNNIQIASFDSADVAAYTDYTGGVAAGETSVFAFIASAGITHVYEFYREPQTGAWIYKPAWSPPYGFTATHMTVAGGIVYLLGNEGNQAILYAMPLKTREPIKVSYVGQAYAANSVTMTTRALAPSYADQVMLGVDDGTTTYIFVYDPNDDAMSQLDSYVIATYGTLRALATFQQQRIAFACATASTTVNVLRWKHDYDTPSRAWTVISSASNIGFPFDEKALFGFQVVQDPSIAAGTVQVEYQIDEDGSYTSAGTTAAGVKYTNIDVTSSNKKFRNIRLRLTGAAGARLFSATARSYINSKQETWVLRLRLDDESAGTNRPLSRGVTAGKLRDYIDTLITNATPVTFLDGTRYNDNGHYTTHSVILERARVVTKPRGQSFEGYADVVLRSTLP